MIQTTKVQRQINGAMKIFYVAVEPDRKGNYQQFSQQEVESSSTGKFEVCESAVGREVLREITRQNMREGWNRSDIERQQRGTTADRLRAAFEKILPPEEAALAARGPMANGTEIDIQGRGRALMSLLDQDLMEPQR